MRVFTHSLFKVAPVATNLWQKRKLLLLAFSLFLVIHPVFSQSTKTPVSGVVRDSSGAGVPNVTVAEKGARNATTTGTDGSFTLRVAGDRSVLVFSSVGFAPQEVTVGNQSSLTVGLVRSNTDLGEVIVVGYGTKTKQSITGAISTVTAKDLDRVHGGSTVSSGLAGKIPGVTFRMADGRPGAGANIQIRNMGDPLYVIDGIQQDVSAFNNLAPNDVESISVLKDGSAAIYGVRAANGVVVVTTKKGRINQGTRINVDAYAGGQSWTRFPTVTNNSYDYARFRAEAEMNSNGKTSYTQAELDKYQTGTDPLYRSFNWKDFIIKNNAPQNSVNINLTGGSDKVNYYLSGTNLFQNSVLGREYKFNRTNIQSNVNAQVTKRLKVSVQINGRIQTVTNPGVPGGDDYNLARQAIYRNTPTIRPYANDNPDYLADNGNKTEANWAFLNYKIAGKYKSDRRVLQTNADAEYQIPGIKGLTVRGVYSYYIEDYLLNNHEYTYNAYTYRPNSQSYERTNGSSNPWREREQIKRINTTVQGHLNYNNTFGQHTVGATFVSERLSTTRLRNWIHASPTTNALPLIYFPTADQYQDSDDRTARIGYVGRVSYNFANRYYIEAAARRDASYLFPPNHRVGYFPNISAGWRITQEPFIQKMLGNRSILSELKLRGNYGVLGDDRNPNNSNQPLVREFGYLEGYNYNVGTAIFGGNAVVGSADAGVPITNLSWLKSKVTDIGLDYGFFNNKLTGSFDYFYRKRTGLIATKSDVVLPSEIGYGLAGENLNSDAQFGGEMSLSYAGTLGNKFNFNIGGNAGYARGKTLDFYKPRFTNSWDQYRNSGVNRYRNISWGYVVDGQFTSQEQINNYPVSIDGKGNSTLLPGDLIYKDQNGDGKIDQYDQRPIGLGYGTQPIINFGFNVGMNYKNFDFHADFSGSSGYTWFQNWETRWAFQNEGNFNTIFEDRWHHSDIYDVTSPWIPGKYPANRYNVGASHSDYEVLGQRNSTFWLHDVTNVRLRTLELGYTIPADILRRIGVQGFRLYLNAYNLLSFDNLKQYGVDPETIDDNGLQFPQNKVINVGVHISL